MAIEVIMPKVDMDQETGTVVEWKKNNGDTVKEGDIILVIETDKVAIDVESMDSGILNGISGEPGDVIPIGTVIAYLLEEGEEIPEISKQSVSVKDSPNLDNNSSVSEVKATPVAKNIADAHGIDLQEISGTGLQDQVTKSDVETYISISSTGNQNDKGKIYATPAARRIAREKSIDLKEITASGPGGRIQAANVEKHQVKVESSPAFGRPTLPEIGITGADQKIPLVGMRRTIAERLTHSYQSIPHIN